MKLRSKGSRKNNLRKNFHITVWQDKFSRSTGRVAKIADKRRVLTALYFTMNSFNKATL